MHSNTKHKTINKTKQNEKTNITKKYSIGAHLKHFDASGSSLIGECHNSVKRIDCFYSIKCIKSI